ncbi:MAG: Asp-tRNA(Asn)/Glu-tRNA(Gln) amidotransferase subunit GatA [Clostridiaceae bacterium]
MDLYKKTAHEIKELIENKEVKAKEVADTFIKRIQEKNEDLGVFLYVDEEGAKLKSEEVDKKVGNGEKLKGLSGVPIAIKDNINVSGMQNTCASKILQGYKAPYDASVIKNIKNADGVILGKVNLDEFAMGSTTENSGIQLTRNPWDRTKVPGGSSGGSAASVAAMMSPLAIGTDTGGSVRQPASLCGVVGLKPTYGRVSRYGVVAFGSTLDQVGTFARDVEDCALLTETLAGLDKNDFTTADKNVPDYKKSLTKDIRGKRIGIPKEYFGEGLNTDVRKAVDEAILVFKENGAEIIPCSLPLTDYALAAYYIISSAEASSNLARFDGVRYGYRSKEYTNSLDLYTKSRSEGFGKEVKRRIMLGTYVLSAGYYDAYYKKALKVRTLIKNDFLESFKNFDAILSPTSPTTAFNIGEKVNDILAMYLSDVYTVPVNIAGIPAISVPCGLSGGLPIGLQLMGNYFREDTLFNLAYSYEQSTSWHKITYEEGGRK